MSERTVPRLSLTKAEAAESLGISLRTFERIVAPDVRMVRRGKVRIIPIGELQRWLDQHSERVLEDVAS